MPASLVKWQLLQKQTLRMEQNTLGMSAPLIFQPVSSVVEGWECLDPAIVPFLEFILFLGFALSSSYAKFCTWSAEHANDVVRTASEIIHSYTYGQLSAQLTEMQREKYL